MFGESSKSFQSSSFCITVLRFCVLEAPETRSTYNTDRSGTRTSSEKPTETKPSLLTFNEVTTLFHEFGHALHGMLANTTYSSLSGTSVSWDFVELPSQILENWCYEKEALALFAKHYQTGEVIPMEYVNKIKESASFHEGMQTLRQLSFGLLDMSWHGGKTPENILSVKEFEGLFKQ